MGRAYAYRLIDSAEVTENLLPVGNIPATERQTRPLATWARATAGFRLNRPEMASTAAHWLI